MLRTLLLSLALAMAFVMTGTVDSTAVTTLYLHGSGATANPPVLFLDTTPATGTIEKYKDSPSINFNGGNPWQQVGTWTLVPNPSGSLTELANLVAWLGLKNSDDQGTQFDLRAEVLKNGAPVTSGLTRCITGVTRNPNLAKQVSMSFSPFAPVVFGGADALSLRLSTRIGTNPDDTKCPGHNNAVGLRVYFDATTHSSSLGVTLQTAPVIVSLGCPTTPILAGAAFKCTPTLSGGAPTSYLWTSTPSMFGQASSPAPFFMSGGTVPSGSVVLTVCNAQGCDMESQTITITPRAQCISPMAGAAVTAPAGSGAVQLTWAPTGGCTQGYFVYFSENTSVGAIIGAEPSTPQNPATESGIYNAGNLTSFTVGRLVPGKTYYFWIFSYGEGDGQNPNVPPLSPGIAGP